MKKRVMTALASGALMAFMVPGVASADEPLVSATATCTRSVTGTIDTITFVDGLGRVTMQITDWRHGCVPGTLEFSFEFLRL